MSCIELLQRQIATKRKQPLNSVTSLEIEQGQWKFKTGSLQGQTALEEVNEKDTGEIRSVKKLQSGMQENDMSAGLTNTECAIAYTKVELERLQRQIAMQRIEKMFSDDSDIERQNTDMLQSGLSNKELQY